MLINSIVVSRFKSNLFDKLTNKLRNVQTQGGAGSIIETASLNPRLLSSDLNGGLQLGRVMSHNLRADAIL